MTMNTFMLRAMTLSLVLFAPTAFAHGTEKHAASKIEPGRETTEAHMDVAPEAAEAAAAVERFSSALANGELDKAGAELAPGVLILESGGVERSRDEYLGGHAKGDAKFLQSAHISLKRRTAKASGDLAWVASESDIHATREGQMLMINSTETMVLHRTPNGWKIAHIHWSSRRAAGSH